MAVVPYLLKDKGRVSKIDRDIDLEGRRRVAPSD